MPTKFGIGYSENPNSFDAGVEAITTAFAEANISDCDLVMMYSTSKHDPKALRDGVRSIIGNKPKLIGGYSNGIITKNKIAYDGYQMGVAVLSSDDVQIDMFQEKGLANNEYKVGLALGNQIKKNNYAGEPNLVLMHDFVKEKPLEGMSWNVNWATPLIAGIGKSLGSWPRTAGMAMMGDWQSNPTYQWFNDDVDRHTAMGLVLSGNIRMDTLIMHGCKPLSDYHTITNSEQNIVLEIDGKPALDVIAELLGPDKFNEWLDYPFFVILGVNKGDKYGDFNEENYANRLIAGVDKARKGLIMFEPDLVVGTEVQMMRRSFSDFNYMRESCEKILDQVKDRNPLFLLYIDCAGRASAYSGTEGEEATMVQQMFGDKMPMLGVYTGSEIAKVGGNLQACVFTGVLCVFSEQRNGN